MTTDRYPAASGAWSAALDWLRGWWHIVQLGALLLVLALAPSSYARTQRPALARHLYLGTAPSLPWFTVLSALAGLVLIRIVTVTAISYGLTQYAIEMVVRVLVLELIPLSAALFVALRYTLPQREAVAALRGTATPELGRAAGQAVLQRELLPRVLAGVFAVLAVAAVSCVVALVIAYLQVYGFTPWAFDGYTRTVGQIFSPPVALIFALKTLGFGLAVALIPLASAVYDAPRTRSAASAELRALMRTFALLLLIEAASLMGNYY